MACAGLVCLPLTDQSWWSPWWSQCKSHLIWFRTHRDKSMGCSQLFLAGGPEGLLQNTQINTHMNVCTQSYIFSFCPTHTAIYIALTTNAHMRSHPDRLLPHTYTSISIPLSLTHTHQHTHIRTRARDQQTHQWRAARDLAVTCILFHVRHIFTVSLKCMSGSVFLAAFLTVYL